MKALVSGVEKTVFKLLGFFLVSLNHKPRKVDFWFYVFFEY